MRSQNGWAKVPAGTGTTGARVNGSGARQNHVTRVVATAATAILATTLTPWVAAPAFATPLPPDNIVVFPDRDFISIQGYAGHAGKFATISVTRGGFLTGRAEGTIQDADPALEVNHPGGVCWGTGAGAPAVTPDIKAGDVVTIAFDGVDADSVVTQSPTVTGFSQGVGLEANKVFVDGTLTAPSAPAPNLANLEQRIVAPALVPTTVGRRDVRAGDSKAGSFTSSITTTATNFTATYTFADVNNAARAAAGQARALTWEVTDAAANRQGMTIAEFGELGGPFVGSCAPATAGAATVPTMPVAAKATAGNSSALVSWREQAAGGSPIIASWVRVVNSANDQVGGLRKALPGDTSLTATGLTNQPYRFQVAAQNRVGLSPFSVPSNVVTPRSTPGAPLIRPANPGAIGGAITARANWLPPASNGGSAINGYVVSALRMSPTGAVLRTTNSAVQHFSTRGLTMTLPAGNYRFVVRARNGLGMGVATSARSSVVAAR